MKRRLLKRALSVVLAIITIVSTGLISANAAQDPTPETDTYYFDIYVAANDGISGDEFTIAPMFGDTTLKGCTARGEFTLSGFIVSYTDVYTDEECTGVSVKMLGDNDMYIDKIDMWSTHHPTVKTLYCGDWVTDDKYRIFTFDTDVYEVILKTGGAEFSGTDADVSLYIESKDEDGVITTTERPCVNNLTTDCIAFENSQQHTYYIATNTTNHTFHRIGIKLSDAGWFDGWLLEYINVSLVQGTNSHYLGARSNTVNQWFADNDCVYFSSTCGYSTAYKIEIKTKSEKGAGTDADLILSINGLPQTVSLLETAEYYYDRSSFESGYLDSFNIIYNTNEPIEFINFLTITNDGSGIKPDWYLEYVKITEITLGGYYRTFTFNYNGWIDAEETKNLCHPNVVSY